MGRMKELFMEMQEQELYDMSLHEYLSMKNSQAMMEEPHPDPESELGDEYWQAKADEQAMYEKHIEEENQKEAELPINKRIPPCAGHDFQEQQD